MHGDNESPSPAAGFASRVRESAMSSSASPGETPRGLPTRDPVFTCRVWGGGARAGVRRAIGNPKPRACERLACNVRNSLRAVLR